MGGGGGYWGNNELGGDTYSTAMELGGAQLSYQVLESRLKCKQGAKNVSLLPSTPRYTHVTNDHLNGTCIKIRWEIKLFHLSFCALVVKLVCITPSTCTLS